MARINQDFYPTPPESFDPLIPYLSKKFKYWEPACGDKRLIHILRHNGFEADGDDLSSGYNFLADNTQREVVVTNPPFSLCQEFFEHAGKVATHEVWMLARLNFLGSQKRKLWWNRNKPAALFVLSKRPSFAFGGTDSCEYAWYYYGMKYKGIYWP